MNYRKNMDLKKIKYLINSDINITSNEIEDYSFEDEDGHKCFKNPSNNSIYYIDYLDEFETPWGVDSIKLISKEHFIRNQKIEKLFLSYLENVPWLFLTSFFIIFLFSSQVQAADDKFYTKIRKKIIDNSTEVIFESMEKSNFAETISNKLVFKSNPQIKTDQQFLDLIFSLEKYKFSIKNIFFDLSGYPSTVIPMYPVVRISNFTRSISSVLSPINLIKISRSSSYIPWELVPLLFGIHCGFDFLSEQLEKKKEKQKKTKSLIDLQTEKIFVLRGGYQKEIYDSLKNLIENYWDPHPFSIGKIPNFYFLSYLITFFFSSYEQDLQAKDEDRAVNIRNEERKTETIFSKVSQWVQNHPFLAIILCVSFVIALINYEKLFNMLKWIAKKSTNLVGLTTVDEKYLQDVAKKDVALKKAKEELIKLQKDNISCYKKYSKSVGDNVEYVKQILDCNINERTYAEQSKECNENLTNKIKELDHYKEVLRTAEDYPEKIENFQSVNKQYFERNLALEGENERLTQENSELLKQIENFDNTVRSVSEESMKMFGSSNYLKGTNARLKNTVSQLSQKNIQLEAIISEKDRIISDLSTIRVVDISDPIVENSQDLPDIRAADIKDQIIEDLPDIDIREN
jgi:hypothetical protein